ncbi:MAG: CHAT domain-containing protein [Pseudomonadota bacterium]
MHVLRALAVCIGLIAGGVWSAGAEPLDAPPLEEVPSQISTLVAAGDWETAADLADTSLQGLIDAEAPADELLEMAETASELFHDLEDLVAAQSVAEAVLADMLSREDRLGEAEASVLLAETLFWRGESERADQLATGTLEIIDDAFDGFQDTRVRALLVKARVLGLTEQIDVITPVLQDALQLVDAPESDVAPSTHAGLLLWASRLHRNQARDLDVASDPEADAQFAIAVSYAEGAIDTYSDNGEQLEEAFARETLSRTLWMMGAREEAVDELALALDAMIELGADRGRNYAILAGYMSYYAAALDDAEAALVWGRRSYAAARTLFLSRLNGPAGVNHQDQIYVSFAATALISALMGNSDSMDSTNNAAFSEALEAAQLTTVSEMGEALVLSSTSAAGRGTFMAEEMSRLQDLRRQWDEIDRRLTRIAVNDAGNQTYLAALERKKLVEHELLDVQARVAERDPLFGAIWDGSGVSVAELQAALAPDEAYLFVVTLYEDVFVFATTSDAAVLRKVSLPSGDLCRLILRVRNSLTESAPLVCDLSDASSVVSQLDPQAFDEVAASDLYKILFAPLDDVIGDKTHWTLTTTRVLSVLPLGALIVDDEEHVPPGDGSSMFLGSQKSLAYVPSAEALVAVRQVANLADNVTGKKILAAGAPCVGAFSGAGCDAKLLSSAEPTQEAQIVSVGSFYRNIDPSADTFDVEDLVELPGAYRELRQLADAFRPDFQTLSGEAFTADRLSAFDWSDTGVFVLATHAIAAGEFGQVEPGLILTPGPNDDGIWSASEIAQAELPVDLVVLSGCSTAGPDGRPRGQMYSGLSLSFLQAGVDTLLVSHFEVDDGFSADFVPGVLLRRQREGVSIAEAVRSETANLLSDPTLSRYHHPRFWAAYSVFGR